MQVQTSVKKKTGEKNAYIAGKNMGTEKFPFMPPLTGGLDGILGVWTYLDERGGNGKSAGKESQQWKRPSPMQQIFEHPNSVDATPTKKTEESSKEKPDFQRHYPYRKDGGSVEL